MGSVDARQMSESLTYRCGVLTNVAEPVRRPDGKKEIGAVYEKAEKTPPIRRERVDESPP